MRDIGARVTGSNYTTFHTYTTEVEVDGRTWTLSIRYNAFHQFYERLLALEKYFTVGFPSKGGLFFSPSPEERQEQLDEFMLSTLAYFDMRGHPKRMETLLNELLEISEHLGVKDEEERTASEGSFEEHEEYLYEDEAVTKVDQQGFKSETEPEAVKIGSVELKTKPEAVEAVEAYAVKRQVHTTGKVLDGQQQLTGIEDITMPTIKENADKSKVTKVETTTEEQQSVKEEIALEVEVETQQKETAVAEVEEKPAIPMVEKKTATHEEPTETAPAQAAMETTAPSTEPEEHVLEPVTPTEADHGKVPETVTKLDAEENPDEANESSLEEGSKEPDLEPCKKDTESENLMVGWFRRITTFGPSSEDKEEQEAVEKQGEEEEAAAQAETEATEAEACMNAEEMAKAEAIEAELLLAAQELNLRLKRYRHPVFFRSFEYGLNSGVVV